MNVEKSSDRTEYYHKLAIEAMRIRNIPLLPDNYTVWYNQVLDAVPEINKEVERLDKTQTKYSRSVNRRLYETYIIYSGSTAPAEKYAIMIQDLLDKIVSEVKGQDGSLNSFTNNLTGMLDKIKHVKDIDDLDCILVDLCADIGKQIVKNKELERSLTEKSIEVDELKKEYESVSREMITDELTGVGNRRGFNRRLAIEISSYVKTKEQFSVLAIDIDKFKLFNDTYGHLVGDKVLCFIAKTMAASIKSKDGIYRVGGEEFMVVLPNTNLTCAYIVGERIRQAIANKVLIISTASNLTENVTVSIGVSSYTSEDSASTVADRADRCLYLSKNNGRNRCTSEVAL